MASLSPFTITELLHDGPSVALYRGRRDADKSSVLIRLLKGESADVQQIERLRHERWITQDLDVDGVIKSSGLEKLDDGLGLIMEDPGGVPLPRFAAAGRLDLRQTLEIFAAAAGVLAALHARGIIHRDVKPANILYRPDTGRVALVGFGVATRAAADHTEPERSPDRLEGTLAYMSPEQTGRMNRAVDHRADLYSLGVSLYEVLTGGLPFAATDPMELVHSQLARVPPKIHERSRDVPEAVSRVVMKLLEKAAEDRYQSALGLQADLLLCLAELREKGQIDPFPLGRHDLTGEIRAPAALYGREAEIAALLDAHDRVIARPPHGAAEIVACRGYAGVGRSAILREAHRAMASRGSGATFVSVAFDKQGRGAPLISAFRSVVRDLLAAPPDVWAQRRAEILAAISPHGRVLVDLIPEIDLVLGREPLASDLAPADVEGRISHVFQRFVRVFTAAGRPLVLFLDDLQWAEPTSLARLKALITDPEIGRLLVIGAYRDHAALPDHPLRALLAAIDRAGVRVTDLPVLPLDPMNAQRLVADALGGAAPWVQPLAELLYAKTHGNPFFLHQLLFELKAEGLLSFDAQARRWVWDEDRILAHRATENVAELMIGKIQRLSPDARRAITLAACIGVSFDLRTLSILHGKTAVETSLDLWEALREGFAHPVEIDPGDRARRGDESPPSSTALIAYRFAHDRIVDAALSLLDEGTRAAIHLQIGRLQRDQLGPTPTDEALFDAVTHCDLGAQGITDPAERLDLARLDLAAGKRAKARAAFGRAAGYLRAGMAILPPSPDGDEYALAFEIALLHAECEHLAGHREEADALLSSLEQEARSRLDQARIATLRVRMYTGAGRLPGAIAAARAGLALFGIALPRTPAEADAALAVEAALIPVNRAGRSVEELGRAPLLADPDERAVRDLLVGMHEAALLGDPALFNVLRAKRANHCLLHGRSEDAAFIYASLVALLILPLGQRDEARDFWRLAEALAESDSGVTHRCKTHVALAASGHLFVPLRAAAAHCERAIQAGVEEGDLHFVALAANLATGIRLRSGDDLGAVEEAALRATSLVRRISDDKTLLTLQILGQEVKSLMGLTHAPGELGDDTFDEAATFERSRDPGYAQIRFQLASTNLELAVLFGDHARAVAMATAAAETAAPYRWLHFASIIPFYAALAHLASALGPDRDRHLEAAAREEAKIAALAESCPENYGYQRLLVAAERARLEDRTAEAADLYDQAIAAAAEQKVTHHEALACEIAGRFYLARGRERIARAYLVDAHNGYLLRGATAKAAQLARQHPGVLAAPAPAIGAAAIAQPKPEGLDVATVIRVGQAIAGEIVLDRLLAKVMRSVIENAGAERGLLLLEQGGELRIEARITVDPDALAVGLAIPALTSEELPRSIVQFVARTREPVVLGDAARDERFGADPYIAARRPRSILSLAMEHQGKLAGILYLENNVLRDAFNQTRVQIAGLLVSQAAIAVANALLVADIQRRTEALHDANERLQRELTERAALELELMRVQTPIIPITDGIMAMPLIGAIDQARARMILETALTGARARRARFVILDITGVPHVDHAVAATLLSTARALGLLGSEAVITGIRPAVAQTLIEIGTNFAEIATKGTLQDGIAFALGRLGRTFQQTKPPLPDPRA